MVDLADKLYQVLLQLLQLNSKQRLSLYEHKSFLVVIETLKRIGGDL